MISGLLQPDTGKILIDGMDLNTDIRRIKKIMGVVPQDMAFYEELSAKENLRFWGKLQGVEKKLLNERIAYYLKKTGLAGRENEPLKKYSGGMKRRINLIIGLIHQPKLMLMDEPITGIDVQTKLNVYELIREIGEKGTTTIYTTHNLKEAEELCHRIAIIDKGKILAIGTLEELIQIVGEKDIVLIQGQFKSENASPILARCPETEILSLQDEKIVLSVDASEKIPPILKECFKAGLAINNISIKQPNLESVFLKLTGKELRE